MYYRVPYTLKFENHGKRNDQCLLLVKLSNVQLVLVAGLHLKHYDYIQDFYLTQIDKTRNK
jgi:hypothetical protein